MTTLSEGNYAGDVVLFEEDNRYSRDEITVVAGADLKVGSVLGLITASGKYSLSDPAAVDGSETPVAVLLQDADAAAADVQAIALLRHARVRRGGLVFHADIDTEAERDTAVAALADVGIIADA